MRWLFVWAIMFSREWDQESVGGSDKRGEEVTGEVRGIGIADESWKPIGVRWIMVSKTS